MQGTPAMFPSTPSPFFIRRGLDLIPQPLFLSQDKGLLVDYEGRPSPSKFWYGAQSLCPFGARHNLSDYAWLVASSRRSSFSETFLDEPSGKAVTSTSEAA